MLLRPYGIVIDGVLELGLELELDSCKVVSIRPHTGIPEPYVISSAFVNAHSHLEYRGLQGVIQQTQYWPWIRELTQRKATQDLTTVRNDCFRAARENRATGVAFVAEHSDRPFAAQALVAARLDGVVFQELITFAEQGSREAKVQAVEAKANVQREHGLPVFVSPHASYTVDPENLVRLGASGAPLSIHLAETDLENEFFTEGTGPIADFYRQVLSQEPSAKGSSATAYLRDLGVLRKGTQVVHACAVDEDDLQILAGSEVTVVHCPRSNKNLACPTAPVREMIDLGITVGLGLDSAASSGEIDMFAEMREANSAAIRRGRAVTGQEIWRLATSTGASSVPGHAHRDWGLSIGSEVDLIKLHITDAYSIQDLIEQGSPEIVEFVEHAT